MKNRKRSGKSKPNPAAASHFKAALAKAAPAVAMMLILFAALALFERTEPAMTGFSVAEKSFTATLDKEITASGGKTAAEMPITLEATPKSMSISGKLTGTGTAKAYLLINGEKYLMLDTSQLRKEKTESLLAITGRIVEEAQEQAGTVVEAVTGAIITDNATATDETEDAQTNQTQTNETTEANETQQTQPPQQKKTITAKLQYNAETAFDSNDDGVETEEGAIDFTAAATEFNWQADETKLCTRWKIDSQDTITVICNGNRNCCALAQLEPKAESWKEPLQIVYGAYDNAVSYENNVSAQVIYADYSPETTEAEVDVAYSDWQTLPAKFLPVTEFRNACEETCQLQLQRPGLNETHNATIQVELENAEATTTLTLDSVTYTTAIAVNTAPRYTPIPTIRVKKNSAATINLSEYFTDEDGDRLTFIASSEDNNITASIARSEMAVVEPKRNFVGNATATFTADDGTATTSSGKVRIAVEAGEKANTPPQLLKQIENMTITKGGSKEIKLPEYFSDPDGDNLSYDHYKAENITIAMDTAASTATIIPDKGFAGKRFSYITAKDAEGLTAVSNVFEITVAAAATSEEKEEIIGRIEINKPVKWKKTLRLAKESNATTAIPAEAANITVTEKSLSIENSVKVEKKDGTGKNAKKSLSEHLAERKSEKKVKNDLEGAGALLSAATEGTATQENITLIIEKNVTEVEVEYETPAPTAEEKELDSNRKQIVVSSDFHYENITAYTTLATEAPAAAVKLYWMRNSSKEEVTNITKNDTNGNGLIDYIEWIVPSLSNQTYEVEIINLTGKYKVTKVLKDGKGKAKGTIKLRKDGIEIDEKDMDSIEAGKYDLEIESEKAQALIRGVNISSDIQLQTWVDDYSGKLPRPGATLSTPVFVFNDTGIDFETAEIVLPKSGDAITIWHCKDWNSAAFDCDQWESPESTVLNSGQNETHAWFTVTEFSSWAGGVLTCDSGTVNDTCGISTSATITSGGIINGNGSIIIKNAGELTAVATNNFTMNFPIGNVTIESGGKITGNVNITTVNMTIYSGAEINVTAKGYAGGNNQAGNGPGAGGYYDSSSAYSGTGAGHGGAGGGVYSNPGGVTYDSLNRPADLGSGGGGCYNAGAGYGNGGGMVLINASGTLSLGGAINASGQNGLTNCGGNQRDSGGGSGGSVWIVAKNFTGSGSISAHGGVADPAAVLGDGEGGGGGGGRVAIYYVDNSTFTGKITVFGSKGGKFGDNGTIYLNHGPSVTTIPNQFVGASSTGGIIRFNLSSYFTDPDDVINYSYAASGTSFNISVPSPNGNVTINITPNIAGTMNVVFYAADSTFNTSSNNVTIESVVLNMTLSLNATIIKASMPVTASGKINLSNGTNASNTEVNLFVDGARATVTAGSILAGNSITNTTDTDFNLGNKTRTATSGRGDNAKLVLDRQPGSGTWTVTTLDTTNDVGAFPSVFVVDSNTVYLSYYNTTAGDLMFKNSSDRGKTWSITVVDSTNNVGQYTSIYAADANNIYISYKDATNLNLMFANSSTAGKTWNTATVESTNDVGSYSSIVALNTSTIYISYYDVTNADLRFANSSDSGKTWNTTAIDTTNDVGKYSSIGAPDANTIYIAYRDATGRNLMFANSSTAGKTWNTATAASTNDPGDRLSMYAFNASLVYVSSYESLSTGDILFINSSNGGKTWSTTTVQSANGDDPITTSIYAADADTIFIAYCKGSANDLVVANSTTRGKTWTLTNVDTSMLQGTTACGASPGSNDRTISMHGLDANTVYVAYSSYSATENNLKLTNFSRTYLTNGTFNSTIINTASAAYWGILNYTNSSIGNISVKVRSCNDAACSGETALHSCPTVAQGASLSGNNCIEAGDHYIQFAVEMNTSDFGTTPDFYDITINYTTLQTDSYGNYNFTLTAPATDGTKTVLTNATYAGTSGNQTATFTVDATAPTITISNPANNSAIAAGSGTIAVNITTNEDSTCKYNNTNPAFDYDTESTPFTWTTANTTHNFTTTTTDGITYSFYYKCQDTAGNVNAGSTYHNFSINATLNITLNLNATIIKASMPVTAAGHINLSNGTNASNTAVNLYVDGTRATVTAGSILAGNSITNTTDTDFNTGTGENISVSGTGTTASIKLSSVPRDQAGAKAATLPTARDQLACAESTLNNKIYCFGGYTGSYLNQIVEYNTTNDTLRTMTATLPTARSYLACAESTLNNKIYCFGGWDTASINNIVEYNVTNNTLRTMTATLPTARYATACAESTLNNKIYCLGGYLDSGGRTNQIVEYNVTNGTLRAMTATLPTARGLLACAESTLNNKIYCFGGNTGTRSNQILEYNLTNDTLRIMTATLPTARERLSCAENPANQKIYCIGGYDADGSLSQIVEYNVTNGTLRAMTATLPTARFDLSCTESTANNRIYCLGGDSALEDLNQIVEFNSSEYVSGGNYTSATIDTGAAAYWNSINYTNNSIGNISVKVRSCNDNACSGETAIASCPTAAQGTSLSGNNCITTGDRWVQFLINLNTTDTTTTPAFHSITINYTTLQTDSYGNYNFTLTSPATDGTKTVLTNATYAGTSGNQTATFTIDATAPSVNISNNASTTTIVNGIVNWTGNFTDNSALGSYIFGFNSSGSFVNDTAISISGTSYSNSTARTITATRGKSVCGAFYVSDSVGNVVNSAQSCFTVANAPVTQRHDLQFIDKAGNHSFNASYAADDADGGANVTLRNISTTAGTCSYLSNATSGSLFNVTYNCSGTANTAATIQINLSDGASGTQSSLLSRTYPNQAPTQPTIAPSTLTNYTSSSAALACSGSTDSEGDTVTYEFYADTSSTPTTLRQNTTETAYTYTATTSGSHYFRCRAHDSLAASGYASTTGLYFDLESPMFNASQTNASTTSTNSSNVSFGVNIVDNMGLDSAMFAHNQSGMFINGTPVKFSGSSAVFNTSITVNRTRNAKVCGIFWANDTMNTSNATAQVCFTVANSAPTFNSNLEAKTANIDTPFAYDIDCTDIDGESMKYYDNTTLFDINEDTGEIADAPSVQEIGSYVINISCQDTDTNTSQTFTYTIRDADAPNVTIILPPAGINASGSLLINVSANDSSNVNIVNLIIYNNTGNATGQITTTRGAGSATAGYWNATINTATLADGNYNISANATDAQGNVNSSQNISMVIDNTKASVSIVSFANLTTQNGTILINASVNDTTSKVFNATFKLTNSNGASITAWLYAQLNSGTTTAGYWNATFDTRTLTDGTYNVTINATDYTGNQQLINISQVEIDNIPNATIIMPKANANISGNLLVNVSANSSNLDMSFVNLTIYNSTGNATGLIVMTRGAGSAAAGYWNATTDTTTMAEGSYNLSVNVTTQGTSTNITENTSITIDNTKPNASIVGIANDTIYSSDFLINISVNDSLTKVFNATFRLANQTSATAWLYATLTAGNSATGYWNATFDMTTLSDGRYNITINATDYANNQRLINLTQVRIDKEPPTFSSLQNNASTATGRYGSVNWSVVVADTAGLGNLTFAFNDSGSFVYDAALSLSDASFAYNVTKGLAASNKTHNVCGFFVFNDTALKQNTTTNSCFDVANTAPIVTINSPATEDHNNVNLTAEYAYSDLDADAGTCNLITNWTINATNTTVANGTTTTIKSNLTLDGNYTWHVSCSDGTATTNSTGRTYILDTTTPAVTWTVPGDDNRSISRQNLSMNVQCSDGNLFRMLVNVTNSTHEIFSKLYDNINETVQTDSSLVNFTTNGTYTAEVSCTDDHTRGKIDNYGYAINNDVLEFKKNATRKVMESEITTEEKVSTITVSYESPAGKLLPIEASQNLTTTFERKADEYKWSYSINLPSKKFKAVLNLSSGKPIYYRTPSSGIPGHFVVDGYYIDFQDVVDEGFNVSVEKAGSSYLVSVWKDSYAEKIGDTLLIDPVSGGLNTVTEYRSYFHNTIPPTFASMNTNATASTKRNDSVNWTVTFSDDVNLSEYIFSINDSGSFINDSRLLIPGQSYVASVSKQQNATRGKQVCARFHFNDTADNQNTTTDSCFTVANSLPVFAETIGTKTANADAEFTYTVQCSDVDMENITYYDNSTLFNINSTTGLINDTPIDAEAGSHTINISCQDTDTNTSQTFTYRVTDSANPTYSGLSNNASTATARNGSVNWTASFSDNLALDSFIFGFNDSGAFVNDSATTMPGTSFLINVTKTKINSTRGKSVCGAFYFNDSSGNNNNTAYSCFDVANTPPVFGADLAAQTALTNETFTYAITCIDHDLETITHYDNTSLFNINPSTGSIMDSPAESDTGTYAINISCQDTDANTSQTLAYTINDATTPTFSGLANNASTATARNGSANWTATFADGVGLGNFTFELNDSGTFAKDPTTEISGTSFAVNITKTGINSTRGKNVCGRFIANDTGLNQNTSSLSCFDVANNAPPAPTTTPSSLTNYTGSASLTCSGIDHDFDTLNYEFYADTGSTPTTLRQNTTETAYTYTATTSGSHYFRCRAHDSLVASGYASTTGLYFDLETPTFNTTINNASSSWFNDTVTFGTNIIDNMGLSFVTFAHNMSGLFVNQSLTAASGRNHTLNATITINVPKNRNICGMFWANDTLNTPNSSAQSCFTTANRAPRFSPALADQTANSDQAFNYDVNCTDDDSDPITYSDNTALFNINAGTGAITDTPGESDVGAYSITITCGDGTINTQGTFTYTVLDATAPTYGNLSNNGSTNTLQNGTVNWSINMHDGNELGSYIFSFNNTGSYVNDTPEAISGTSKFVNVTKTITATEGSNVCAIFFINDSANNRASTTSSCFTVAAATDITFPTYSGFANNASTTSRQNASVNWSINLADNSALSSYTFGFNGSGAFVNDTTQSISGTSWTANITKNINKSRNNYVCGAFYFNDTTGNNNNTPYSCYTVANTAPHFSPALADQTAGSGQPFSYDVNCTDIDGDTITYSDNTALFSINSGTGAITHTPTESDTGSYAVTITCGDGTENTQDSFTYTINDEVKPTYTGLANNASTVTLQNGAVNWSVTLADGVALSTYTFSFNNTGSYVNDTPEAISGTSKFVNVTKTITIAGGSNVCARFYFNDTSGNGNATVNSCFTAKQPATNNIPTTPTITFPANNSYVNQQAVQLNASSSDADNEAITYYHYINGTLNQTSTDANATFTATDAHYTYKAYASDGINNSANSTEVAFTKDTAIPFVNFSGGTAGNATNFSRNWIFVNASVTELNEANITFRIYNSTVTVSSQTFADKTRSNNFTSLSDGTYFYNITVDDLAGSRNTTQTRQIRLDTSAPLLSNISAIMVTNNSAVIKWNTNENANSSLSYGLTTNYSAAIENNTNSTTHFIAISGLNESVTYHYKVSSTDSLGNTNTSADLTFTTQAVKRLSQTFTANTTRTVNTSEAKINTVLDIITKTSLAATQINITGGTETPTNKTLNITALKYVEIKLPDTLYGEVTSIMLKVFYNETEITGKNLSESSLAMHRYNESKADWEKLNTSMGMVLDTGVNTTDNYVFANITNFSSYAVGGRLDNGASCTESSQCDSDNCATGFDGNKYCAVAGGCANAGTSYANTETACDDSSLQTCSSGSWTSSACTWGCTDGACNSAPAGSTSSSSSGGSGGGGGGGGGGAAEKDMDSLKEEIKKISKAITGITVDTKEITREMSVGDTATATVNLKNSRKEEVKLEISVEGDVSRFVYAPRDIIIPAEGSEKLTVSLVVHDDAKPKVYSGEITLTNGKDVMRIPVTLKVSEKLKGEKLLDIKVEPLEKTLAPGDELKIQSTIYNLGSSKRIDVQMTIEVINPRTNETIIRQEKALAVETSASSLDRVKLPEGLQYGRYTIIGTAYYTENGIRNEAKSVSEIEVRKQLFEILKPYLFRKYRFIAGWQLLAIALLIPVSAYAYLKYRKIAKQRRRYNVLVDFGKLPKSGSRSAFVGKIAETGKAAYIEMDKLQTHTIVAGATGSGKTVAAQGIVEEALQKNTAVMVFDPTAQWSGFLRKCTDRRMLEKYGEFGLRNKNAKAFLGNVRQVTDPLEVIDIKKSIEPGRINVFAINKLEPKEIDTFIANTIREVFRTNFEESQNLRLLLVYDEVHRLLAKFGGSGEGLVQLERAARECRKWGIGLVLISQVLTDFVGEIKANIATQIQMRTSDEGDLERIRTKYGDEFVKSIVKASVGTGMLENSEYNKGRAYFVSFRPLLHSTTRLPDSELEQYNKFNEVIDELESQMSQLRELNVDVFDLEIELKLAKEKLGTGNFNMVLVYLESLEPRISATWKKLNKTPKKLEKKRTSTSELKAEVTKARIERKKIEVKEEKQKLDKRIFNKKLEKGSLFIIREKGADTSFKLLSSSLRHYGQGLCFTRHEKTELTKKYKLGKTRIETITTEAAESAYSPTSVSEIYKEIKEFASKNKTGAVMIDGLALIINYAGLEQAYNLLQRIKDTISGREIICIIPVNTEILNKEQAKKLEEFTTIEG